MPKKLSAWNKHVKSTARANPNLRGAALFKKASRTYGKGNKQRVTSRSTSRSRSVAKNTKPRRKRAFTIPVPLVIALLSKFSSAAINAKAGNWNQARKDLMWHFALIDNNGNFNSTAIKTWYGVAIAMGIHLIAKRFGINRALGRAGVPIVRL